MIKVNIIKFYEFLNGDISILDFEKYIYNHPELEQKISKEVYLALVSINFKDQQAKEEIENLIKTKIIEIGKFETWKLERILNNFIDQPDKIDVHLNTIYHLYCGIYQDNNIRKYEYKFLRNLGLNYFYWMEEEYLKTIYGDKWKIKLEKYKSEFKFYHHQLKKFAIEILLALENKEIEILNDGTYIISEDLKNHLEANDIYKLKHPKK